MAHVIFDDVTFHYPVYDVTGRSLKVSLMRKLSAGQSGGVVKVKALSNVSFELRTGDRLGIIGRNGAGKSTLLRLIAKLIYPQQGRIDIEGLVVPLLTTGVGMHWELSGLDNIELPMRFLGASNAEIAEAKRTIPEWTALGDFVHLPVRTYSDGMRARLMFAISTALRSDVLVLDEWLGAGDADFVEKAQQRLWSLVDSAGIVVLSSHSMEIIRNLCNVVCWMEQGEIVMIGPAEHVIPAYLVGAQKPLRPSERNRAVA